MASSDACGALHCQIYNVDLLYERLANVVCLLIDLETFQYDVVVLGLKDRKKRIDLVLMLDLVLVWRLAELTLVRSPSVRCHIVQHFHVLCSIKPGLQALQVNKSQGSRTLAGCDQWILSAALILKANPASMALVAVSMRLHSLLKFLLDVKFAEGLSFFTGF